MVGLVVPGFVAPRAARQGDRQRSRERLSHQRNPADPPATLAAVSLTGERGVRPHLLGAELAVKSDDHE